VPAAVRPGDDVSQGSGVMYDFEPAPTPPQISKRKALIVGGKVFRVYEDAERAQGDYDLLSQVILPMSDVVELTDVDFVRW